MWPIERTLSGATTPDQSGSGSNDNEGILHIFPKVHQIVYCFIQDTRWEVLPSAQMQLVYSTTLADWAVLDYATLCINKTQ